MDDLLFYVLFDSISVIYGQCLDDNERLCPMDLVYGDKDFHLKQDSNPGGTPRSVS